MDAMAEGEDCSTESGLGIHAGELGRAAHQLSLDFRNQARIFFFTGCPVEKSAAAARVSSASLQAPSSSNPTGWAGLASPLAAVRHGTVPRSFQSTRAMQADSNHEAQLWTSSVGNQPINNYPNLDVDRTQAFDTWQ